MRGITRPCRHSLPPELHERWRSHLCGLCLTLRQEVGQAARVLTGYDTLLPSVLVEAQTGRADTVTAGRCPLRGLRTAEVVPPGDPGARFAAGASLLNGATGLDDKLVDADVPGWMAPALRPAAGAARRHGRRLTDESGFAAEPFVEAAPAAAAAERTGRGLDDYLEPAGRVGAALFAHTSVIADRPENEAPLARAGDAFGRLVHLIDAVDDFSRDSAGGAFNPLAASRTPPAEGHRAARGLASSVAAALAEVRLVDPDLAVALLGPVLDRAVERHFGHRPVAAPAVAAATLTLVLPAVFGGRRWGRRPPPGYYGEPYDPYYGPRGYGPRGYGYGRRGPSCCDLLACDCCANCACNECCGDDDDCCCCCC